MLRVLNESTFVQTDRISDRLKAFRIYTYLNLLLNTIKERFHKRGWTVRNWFSKLFGNWLNTEKNIYFKLNREKALPPYLLTQEIEYINFTYKNDKILQVLVSSTYEKIFTYWFHCLTFRRLICQFETGLNQENDELI